MVTRECESKKLFSEAIPSKKFEARMYLCADLLHV